MDITSPQFGKQVKKRMYDLEITQKQLAAWLGITAPYLNDILHEKRIAGRWRVRIVELLDLLEKKQKGGKLKNA